MRKLIFLIIVGGIIYIIFKFFYPYTNLFQKISNKVSINNEYINTLKKKLLKDDKVIKVNVVEPQHIQLKIKEEDLDRYLKKSNMKNIEIELKENNAIIEGDMELLNMKERAVIEGKFIIIDNKIKFEGKNIKIFGKEIKEDIAKKLINKINIFIELDLGLPAKLKKVTTHTNYLLIDALLTKSNVN